MHCQEFLQEKMRHKTKIRQTIRQKSSKQSDALSRIPARENQTEQAPDIHMELHERGDQKVVFSEQGHTRPIGAEEIRRATNKDPILSKVRSFTLQ